MKEKLYTIPLNDAVDANCECPFCYVERNIEQDLLDFVLGSGSSYMESDIREKTDVFGFCREHFKKMFDYGNALGNGWILKTHYKKTLQEMKKAFKGYKPVKLSLKESLSTKIRPGNSVSAWINERNSSCYICNEFADTYERYLDTFLYLYKNDKSFVQKIKQGKGFCLTHFGDLCNIAESKLSKTEKEPFFQDMFQLMEDNMERLYEDVSWLIDMFDYRNKDADWKNSKDAIQRGMQKMKGGFPGDTPYKMKK